ncbi:MAG: cation transporter [Thermoanaerobaculia bacterium]|nr:cation transporter [Thermoanaerobaculia bacterium]
MSYPSHSATAIEDPSARQALVRRGLLLEYLTVGYNSLEGIIAIAAGLLAGSIALVGFGFDSAIEVISGMTLLWRLRSDADETMRERIEQRAIRIVGVSFLLLAAYVTVDAAKALLRQEAPDESIVGIVLAAVSLVIMPLLVRAKRRIARAIGSRALDADATQTQICTYLSAILLGGLLLNATLGWWWADPVAALVMVPIIVREGLEGLRGERCEDECEH